MAPQAATPTTAADSTAAKQPTIDNVVGRAFRQLDGIGTQCEPPLVSGVTAGLLPTRERCRKQRLTRAVIGSKRGDIATLMEQALAVLEPAQLFAQGDRRMAVRTQPKVTACGEVVAQREQSIPQICLGGWTQSNTGSRCRQRADFGGIQMGGMNQAPPRIHRCVIE